MYQPLGLLHVLETTVDQCREILAFRHHWDSEIFGLCQRHGLAVPRAGDRSYVTGLIRGWSRSHLTYVTGGC